MIQVKDNNEPLVDIMKVCPGIINGMDPLRKRYGESLFLRKTVAEMLKNAMTYLPPEVTFIVVDAWRPKEAQAKFYDYYEKKFSSENPDWSKEKIKTEAGKYAIPPDQLYRADHVSGGAIDLGLIKNGRRLPIMARQIPFREAVLTSCPNLPLNVYHTRQLLSEAMTRAGFANYPKEYWHWCFGGYMWAELTNNDTAIYGTAEL